GLEALGMGLFSGRLDPQGDGLAVNGSFKDGAGNARPASGRITWSDGVLTGEITRSGYPSVSIELRRVR
ncbi:MAG: hypothetical protein KJ061_13470, partial [Vicinamibacteraceae bacterium]|nr:hypothetical protein [Vicinamibacteraceae bacterium]